MDEFEKWFVDFLAGLWCAGVPRNIIKENTERAIAQYRAFRDKQAKGEAGDDMGRKYYNEVAKNYLLWNIASDLLTALELWDPNNKLLEKAEDILNDTYEPGSAASSYSWRINKC